MSTNAILEQFGHVRKSLNQFAMNNLRMHSIGPKQMIMLMVIAKRGVLTLKELADATVSDPAAISRALSVLIRDGLIAKNRHPDDARQWQVKLTKLGQKKVPELNRVYSRLSEELVRDLDAAERESLFRLLKKIAVGFDRRNQAKIETK